jgi:flagellar basal-body rod protein FlgG
MADMALQAAVSGSKVAQARIDNISNNIANISTTGYKKTDIQASDLFYMNLKKAGVLENTEASRRPVGVQVGMGAKVIGTYRNLAQGAPKQTDQPLDVVIKGSGYFAIALPGGRVGYTRAGSFKRDGTTGDITTIDGKRFNTNINIDPNVDLQQIDIGSDGAISRKDPTNNATSIPLDQLLIFTFPNDHGLEAIGDNLLIATPASGEAVQVEDTSNVFEQGWLEQSNVTAVEELTELITAQRAYELNNRVIRVVDEVSKDINALK